jgi:hypothetical protein
MGPSSLGRAAKCAVLSILVGPPITGLTFLFSQFSFPTQLGIKNEVALASFVYVVRGYSQFWAAAALYGVLIAVAMNYAEKQRASLPYSALAFRVAAGFVLGAVCGLVSTSVFFFANVPVLWASALAGATCGALCFLLFAKNAA